LKIIDSSDLNNLKVLDSVDYTPTDVSGQDNHWGTMTGIVANHKGMAFVGIRADSLIAFQIYNSSATVINIVKQ